jgi:hypothetical protein
MTASWITYDFTSTYGNYSVVTTHLSCNFHSVVTAHLSRNFHINKMNQNTSTCCPTPECHKSIILHIYIYTWQQWTLQQQRASLHISYLNYDVLSRPQLTHFQAEVRAGEEILKWCLQNTIKNNSSEISVPCHFRAHNSAVLGLV